jgi:hypothetical protein
VEKENNEEPNQDHQFSLAERAPRTVAQDLGLLTAILKFMRPAKNDSQKEAAEFLASRIRETCVYLKFDPERLDDYLSWLRQQLNLSDHSSWADLYQFAERMEEHLDARDLMDH